MCHEVAKPRRDGEPLGEAPVQDAALGEGEEQFSVPRRHVATAVRQPVRGERHALLERDEEIENHDLPRGAIGLKRSSVLR